MSPFAPLPIPMFTLDHNGHVTSWNYRLEALTGIGADEVVGTDQAWLGFHLSKHPVLASSLLNGSFDHYYSEAISVGPDAWEITEHFENCGNSEKWLIVTASVLRNELGEAIGAVQTMTDITNLKRAEIEGIESRHLMSQIIDNCPVPMFVIDRDHRITHWNKASENIMGTPAQAVIGSREHWQPFYPKPRPVMADLVMENDTFHIAEYYAGKFQPSTLIQGAWEATDYFPNFAGGPRWLYFTAARLHGTNGQVIGALETLQDISEQKRYEEELKSWAMHDALTGLCNRRLLDQLLLVSMAQAKRESKLIAIMFIDLDHFKPINDHWGHAAGDVVLTVVAQRLLSMVRAEDCVARIGGDEFIVALYAPESVQFVEAVAQRIIETIGQPMHLNDQIVKIGCSIGISLFPQDGNDFSSLLLTADQAMYLSKQRNRNTFTFSNSKQ